MASLRISRDFTDNCTHCRIPLWRPATSGSAGVNIPNGGKDGPLRSESELRLEEQCRPPSYNGEDTHGVSDGTLLAAELGEFESPVDGSEERKNDSTV